MQHHVDRFYAAVEVLAGDGNIKQRLISAYQDNLDDLSEEGMPQRVRAGFADLKARLHCVTPVNGEPPVCATVRKMSSSEASRCAVSLLSLYADLMNCRTPADSADVGAPFIVKSVG